MTRLIITTLLVAFLCAQANAQQRTYRRRGVILGGLAGAALGVAIGSKGNNEGAGALIGGVAGAFAGGTIGNQKDQRIEHDQRYHSGYQGHSHSRQYAPAPSQYPAYQSQQRGYRHYPAYNEAYVYPQQPAYAPIEVRPIEEFSAQPARPVVISSTPVAREVTKDDVLTMTRSGMSSPLIVRQIEINGAVPQLSVADVIELHQSGVSEEVIAAMQNSIGIVGTPVVNAVPTPVLAPTPAAVPQPRRSYSLPTPVGEQSLLTTPPSNR